ncbi:MAG: 16S rRNA (uracil(1498)-N(3))-methyltransferase [Bacilli bacterium]|nr:16S rRNA (uracil(1498)-N(3))-methyltransferase [Bacilli bacterium]
MQRYFSLSRKEIILDEGDIHHITHVMRNKVGDFFEVIFNEKIYKMRITSLRPLTYVVDDISSLNNELKHDITLFYCLSKGEKNEFVIQKATELGVKRIVLLSSLRSVVKMNDDDFSRKKARYEKILKEASEQSHRNIIPEIIGIIPIKKIPAELLNDHNLIAYEEEAGNTSKTYELLNEIKEGESVSVLIGSEGGIDKSELEILHSQDFKNISLGKRILRTETAAMYALSVISFMLER